MTYCSKLWISRSRLLRLFTRQRWERPLTTASFVNKIFYSTHSPQLQEAILLLRRNTRLKTDFIPSSLTSPPHRQPETSLDRDDTFSIGIHIRGSEIKSAAVLSISTRGGEPWNKVFSVSSIHVCIHPSILPPPPPPPEPATPQKGRI